MQPSLQPATTTDQAKPKKVVGKTKSGSGRLDPAGAGALQFEHGLCVRIERVKRPRTWPLQLDTKSGDERLETEILELLN